jgi:hypothetical protein
MNHKTILALALASAFALSSAQVLAEDEKKETEKPQVVADEDKKETSPYPQLIADEDKKETSPFPQLIADEDKKETSPYPQLIADEDKKDTEKPQLVAEADDVIPSGSTPELTA